MALQVSLGETSHLEAMISAVVFAVTGLVLVESQSTNAFDGASFDGALEILKSRAPVRRPKLSILSGVVEELQQEFNLPLAMITQAVDDGV